LTRGAFSLVSDPYQLFPIGGRGPWFATGVFVDRKIGYRLALSVGSFFDGRLGVRYLDTFVEPILSHLMRVHSERLGQQAGEPEESFLHVLPRAPLNRNVQELE
jgi:hypothetical protein